MGYKLYREIRDLAPDDWTPAEFAVAQAIADNADEGTRQSFRLTMPELLRRVRGINTMAGLRRVLQRLADRGFEFRVPIKTGKDGRPVYAHKGHAADFIVPPMPAERPTVSPGTPAKARATARLSEGEPSGSPSTAKERPAARLKAPKASPAARPSPETTSPGFKDSPAGSPNKVSRLARTSPRTARTRSKHIRETRFAIAGHYGTDDSDEMSDGEILEFLRAFAPGGDPRLIVNITRYLSAPFGDAPEFGSLREKIRDGGCAGCGNWSDECACPPPPGTTLSHCPSCGVMFSRCNQQYPDGSCAFCPVILKAPA